MPQNQSPPPKPLRPPDSTKESGDMRKQAKKAIEAGDLDRAARLAEAGCRTKIKSEQAAWFLLSAEIETARKDYPRAGLAAMRLVVLYPATPQAATALFWTARAYEEMGRPGKATKLYEECAAHKAATDSLKKRARARSAELKRPAATSTKGESP